MKRFLMTMVIALMTMSIGISTVEAKRLGGGGSFGKQSQGVSKQAPPAQQQSAANANRPTNPQSAAAASPWRGILGGALLGLGLGALLSQLGLSEAMASMISTILMVALLAFAVMFIIRMVRRKSGENMVRPAYSAGANTSQEFTPRIGSQIDMQQAAALRTPSFASGSAANEAVWTIPADFDTAGFLRHAKTYFIRLQAAWDKGEINDIREFTSPEMFAELKMQIEERGTSANHTDVLSLDAELLGIETVGSDYLASVKFSGMIKESENASTESFTEVWNLAKPIEGQGGWVLAGIQQVS